MPGHRDKGGKIASLEDTLDGADEIIDISNLTAVPGVIDMHVHVTRSAGRPRRILYGGQNRRYDNH